MSGAPSVCASTSRRRVSGSKSRHRQMGQHERCEDGWPPPDVVIPDGTTFPEDPSTQKKYVVKSVEAAVENCLLLKDEASACADMSYPTDMSIPQTSDFPDFTMPRINRICLLSRYELRTRRRESPGGVVECVTAWRSRGQDFRFFFKETNNFKSTSGWFSRGRGERKRSKLWASSSRAGIFCFTLFFVTNGPFYSLRQTVTHVAPPSRTRLVVSTK